MFEFGEPDMALEARRDILNLRPGTQIPGYTGHRPGVRYGFGQTYGHQTRLSYVRQFESKEEDEPNDVVGETLEISADGGQEENGSSNVHGGSRSRFIFPDPKNDSSAVGELLRGGGPVPYADFYRIHRRPRFVHVDLTSSPSVSDTKSFQHHRRIVDGGHDASAAFHGTPSENLICNGGDNNYHWSLTSHRPIPIADERRVREKLRLYKAMREQRERNDPSRRSDTDHLQFGRFL